MDPNYGSAEVYNSQATEFFFPGTSKLSGEFDRRRFRAQLKVCKK